MIAESVKAAALRHDINHLVPDTARASGMPTPARVAVLVAMVATLAAIIALTSVTALAAPPPPPPPIPAVREPVDGYDLRIPWTLWNVWVDDRRGPVLDALLEAPEAVDGDESFGPPVIKVVKTGFHGRFATAEVRVYCRKRADWVKPRRGCHYRLRFADVALPTWDYGSQDNPITTWTRESFDPVTLVNGLRAAGIGPEANFRDIDRARLFSSLPSPDGVLRANATITVVDSRDCSALRRALEALDRRTFSARLDLPDVGQDTRWRPPEYVEEPAIGYTLRIGAHGTYSGTEITGAGTKLERLVEPILAAGRACAKGAGRAGGR